MSVAQADEVIIALPGDKSKMSIYEKNPSGEGFDFNWRLYVLRGIYASPTSSSIFDASI